MNVLQRIGVMWPLFTIGWLLSEARRQHLMGTGMDWPTEILRAAVTGLLVSAIGCSVWSIWVLETKIKGSQGRE